MNLNFAGPRLVLNITLDPGELVLKYGGAAWSVASFSITVYLDHPTSTWISHIGLSDFRAYPERVVGGWNLKKRYPGFQLRIEDISGPVFDKANAMYSALASALPLPAGLPVFDVIGALQ